MHALLHLASFFLLLPNLVFAAGFLLLGHAIAGETLPGFLWRLLSDALALVTWGMFAAGAVLVSIAGGGLFRQTLRPAALCVAMLAAGSIGVLIALDSGPSAFGQWLFLLPGALALCMSGWLVFAERP